MDELVATKGHRVGLLDRVAPLCQVAVDLRRQALLKMEDATRCHHRPGRLRRTGVVEARRIPGLLVVHPKIHQVDDNLDMPLRLHAAPHQTEGRVGCSIPPHEGRDDGVEGALAGLEGVGVLGIEGEERAPVLDSDADLGHHIAGAEAGVVGLDQRHQHAVRVGRHQKGRVSVVEGWVTGLDGLGGPLHVDELGPFGRIALFEEPINRDIDK